MDRAEVAEVVKEALDQNDAKIAAVVQDVIDQNNAKGWRARVKSFAGPVLGFGVAFATGIFSFGAASGAVDTKVSDHAEKIRKLEERQTADTNTDLAEKGEHIRFEAAIQGNNTAIQSNTSEIKKLRTDVLANTKMLYLVQAQTAQSTEALKANTDMYKRVLKIMKNVEKKP